MYMQVTSKSIVSSKNIVWRGLQGITEFSDLGITVGKYPTLLDICSHRTGDTVSFYLNSIRKSPEDQLLWIDYRTWKRKQPLFLRVFND